MPTGYEVKMYNDINRIANCLEAAERRAREREEKYPKPLYDPEVVEDLVRRLGLDKPVIDPNSLGAKALWMQEVAAGDCLIGFAGGWIARGTPPLPKTSRPWLLPSRRSSVASSRWSRP